MANREIVSLVRCVSTADDAEVVSRTQEAIEQLGDYGRGLREARRLPSRSMPACIG